jgi:hypothetical protein
MREINGSVTNLWDVSKTVTRYGLWNWWSVLYGYRLYEWAYCPKLWAG